MICDESLTSAVENEIKKAIWQSRNDADRATQILTDRLKNAVELRSEIAAVLVRSCLREMIWNGPIMGPTSSDQEITNA